MEMLTNSIKESQLNKHLDINKRYGYLKVSLKEHLSLNAFKPHSRKPISIFDTQITSGLKRIVIEKSFFENNISLLLELLDLPYKTRSIILVTSFQEVFNICLANKRAVIIK